MIARSSGLIVFRELVQNRPEEVVAKTFAPNLSIVTSHSFFKTIESMYYPTDQTITNYENHPNFNTITRFMKNFEFFHFRTRLKIENS